MRVGRIIVVAAIAALSSAFVVNASHARPWPWPTPSTSSTQSWTRTTAPAPPPPTPSGGAETGGGGSYDMPIAGLGALGLAGVGGAFLFLYRRRDELA
jgi:hypothetical protein